LKESSALLSETSLPDFSANLARPVRILRVFRTEQPPDAELVDAVPRYLPGWSRPIVRLPGAREVLTWNLLVVLRRPQQEAAR
jgi:hypothetical protein